MMEMDDAPAPAAPAVDTVELQRLKRRLRSLRGNATRTRNAMSRRTARLGEASADLSEAVAACAKVRLARLKPRTRLAGDADKAGFGSGDQGYTVS